MTFKFDYRRRERLLPFGNVNDNFDNDRLENVYFHYFHYVPR